MFVSKDSLSGTAIRPLSLAIGADLSLRNPDRAFDFMAGADRLLRLGLMQNSVSGIQVTLNDGEASTATDLAVLMIANSPSPSRYGIEREIQVLVTPAAREDQIRLELRAQVSSPEALLAGRIRDRAEYCLPIEFKQGSSFLEMDLLQAVLTGDGRMGHFFAIEAVVFHSQTIITDAMMLAATRHNPWRAAA